MERYFFNTFGYYILDIKPAQNLIPIFEEDVSRALGLVNIGTATPYVNINERKENLRNGKFFNDSIFNIFYNQQVLDTIYKLTDDFVILSPMESFYLTKSHIHRDLASEIKTIKLLFYLDDVSDISKGPLYVIPGTQNLYDKYSISIGNNVCWPPPIKGGGAGFSSYNEYLKNNIPKKYLFSNADKIIMFNSNLFHGSDGNVFEPTRLRRSIGMTLICVNRTDDILMKKIDNFFNFYNVNNTETQSYLYCRHYKINNWVKHFYFPKKFNINFHHSEDGTDKNSLILSSINNRWNNYINELTDKNNKESIHDNIYNCYKEQIKTINRNLSDEDIQGL